MTSPVIPERYVRAELAASQRERIRQLMDEVAKLRAAPEDDGGDAAAWMTERAALTGTIEILRLALARAIRGCDPKERVAIEADLKAEGVEWNG